MEHSTERGGINSEKKIYIVGVECPHCHGECYPFFDVGTPEGTIYTDNCTKCGGRFRVRFTLDMSIKCKAATTWLLPHAEKVDEEHYREYTKLQVNEFADKHPEHSQT